MSKKVEEALALAKKNLVEYEKVISILEDFQKQENEFFNFDAVIELECNSARREERNKILSWLFEAKYINKPCECGEEIVYIVPGIQEVVEEYEEGRSNH